MYHLVPIANILALWGLAAPEESMLRKWGNPMDELDGRDELVRRHYRNRKDMIATISKPDKAIEGYTDPWQRAYYSKFDDFLPIRPAEFESTVWGMNIWRLPVTVASKESWFDQMDMGTLHIREIPNGDGTSEFVMKILG